MQQSKGLILWIVAITILSNSCSNTKGEEIQYGYKSRLMTSLIEMNCAEDNLALYDKNDAYIFSKDEYSILLPEGKNAEIGATDFVFKIRLKNPKVITSFVRPRISFCKNGKTYIGRANVWTSLPPACHFYFRYNENDKLTLTEKNELPCFSTRFLSPEEYAKEVLGIEE